MANRFGRDCTVLALGGGVVGDLAGFAAACYQRGVAFAQLPTTLLAQVDSSVGGKTGVNHPGGKNLVGAFHQPSVVLADTAALRTLPARELRAGLAEVVKYGLVFDLKFLDWIERNVDQLLGLDPAALAHAIHRSCQLKAEVVRRDEREAGDRALLNLGHTFGHAIETATGYTQWLHGEAVATGMVIAADLSAQLGMLTAADVAAGARAAGADRTAGAGAAHWRGARTGVHEPGQEGQVRADSPGAAGAAGGGALHGRLRRRCAARHVGQALRVAMLAPYAAHEERTRGRRFPEPPPQYRGEYQRDRDRIVHSGAFRRLVYKTQVFVNHEGDLYRTRLTHSMEVAQIARSIARALELNESLTEAICLAHDLGHTPFGHAGQDALNECMREFGGFEHNLQSLRVVDELEERYADFNGLNLTFETREGILKHCSIAKARELGELGLRFIERKQAGLEAQLANVADEIAYNNHDVDDGLRAGFLELEQLQELPIVARQLDEVRQRYPKLAGRRLVHETVRRMINYIVVDVIQSTSARLHEAAPRDIDAVRASGCALVDMSDQVRAEHLQLKRFLRDNLYRHYRVQRMTRKARNVVGDLFRVFMEDVLLMPDEHRAVAQRLEAVLGAAGRARAVADYVAGMTDRYAISEHDRLFVPAQRS